VAPVGRLQKRVVEPFLARIVAVLPEQAGLKGDYALQLRLERVPATHDVDLALHGVRTGDAIEALCDADPCAPNILR